MMLAACSTILWGQLNWEQTFFSAQLSDETVIIRTNAEPNSSIDLYTKDGPNIQSSPMPTLNDGFSNYQVQVTSPTNPYIGFKSTTGNLTEVLPVFHNSPSAPSISELTPLFDDPVGDSNFAFTNLDITGVSAAFSNDKLYFAITNNGGGFPTNSGYTYFAYLAALVNPDADSTANTTVYGLMHTVTITGIVGPGLYKITGTGITDMTQIGQITTTTYNSANTLVLACNISDLMADADFSSWFDPSDPKLGFIALTNRISLVSGSEVADQSQSCNIIPQPVQINQNSASIPLLSGIQTSVNNQNHFQVNVTYDCPEAFLPAVAQIDFDNGYTSYFTPLTFPDFNNPVPFEAIINLDSIQNWNSATIRFSSDGAGFAEYQIFPTTSDEHYYDTPPSVPLVNIFPNPAKDKFTVDVKSARALLNIGIYDIKGRKVDTIQTWKQSSPYTISFDLIKSGNWSEGIYLVRIDFSDTSVTRKIAFIKQ